MPFAAGHHALYEEEFRLKYRILLGVVEPPG